MQTLTEEEVRVVYQDKQKEPFPRRKLWLGAFYAVLLIVSGVVGYMMLFWVVFKIACR
jgi:hypothetical protein